MSRRSSLSFMFINLSWSAWLQPPPLSVSARSESWNMFQDICFNFVLFFFVFFYYTRTDLGLLRKSNISDEWWRLKPSTNIRQHMIGMTLFSSHRMSSKALCQSEQEEKRSRNFCNVIVYRRAVTGYYLKCINCVCVLTIVVSYFVSIIRTISSLCSFSQLAFVSFMIFLRHKQCVFYVTNLFLCLSLSTNSFLQILVTKCKHLEKIAWNLPWELCYFGKPLHPSPQKMIFFVDVQFHRNSRM